MQGDDKPVQPAPVHPTILSGHTPRRSLRGMASHLAGRLRVRTHEEYNERVLHTEVIFQAIAGAGALSFVGVFLVRLGASNLWIGLFTSLPALVTILAVLPLGVYVQRQRNLVVTANRMRLIFRLVVAAFALLPLIPNPKLAPIVMVVAWSIIAVPSAALNIAIVTIWGKATTPQRRPRMLSTRLAIAGLVSAGVGFLSGQWLDHVSYPLNYQLLFISALLAAFGSVAMLARLRLPEVTDQEVNVAKSGAGLRQMLPRLRDTPAFRNYSISALVFRLGLNLPGALWTIFQVRIMGASDAWIGILLTAQQLTSVVGYFVLGRMLGSERIRRHLWVSCFGSLLYPLTMAMVHTPQGLMLPNILLGLFGAGFNTFMTNILFQVSPAEERPTFVSIDSFLGNIVAFAAPLAGTLLYGLMDIRLVFLISAALRVVGTLLFWWLGVGTEEKPAQ